MLIAEHSMCQPGRPSPTSVVHDGSPGLGPFHSAKSRTSSLPYSSAATRSPERAAPGSSRASLPYAGQDGDAEEDRPVVGAVRVALLEQLATRSAISGMCCVARDRTSGGPMRRAARSPRKRAMCGAGELVERPAGGLQVADDPIVDVGDVHHPGHRRSPATRGSGERGRRAGRRGSCRCVPGRRRSARSCTCARGRRSSGWNSSSLPPRVLVRCRLMRRASSPIRRQPVLWRRSRGRHLRARPGCRSRRRPRHAVGLDAEQLGDAVAHRVEPLAARVAAAHRPATPAPAPPPARCAPLARGA